MIRHLLFLAVAGLLMFAAASSHADPAMPGMPPNIQKIMQKLQSGQAPTPAEQKALQAWGESMAGIKPGSPEAQAINSAPSQSAQFTVGSGNEQNPCRKVGHATGFGVTPSRDAYVAMARDAMRAWRAKMPVDGAARLNDVLSHATNPDWGGGFALLLIAHGSGSAAIVSAAYAAQKNPANAVTANNLGIALRGMKDYARAAVALQYAKSLAPSSDVVATNLGWLAMSQGDAKSAGAFFNAALSKNRQMSSALAGLGLIQQCAGHSAQALPLFRASLKAGFSDLAAAGIESAKADIANSKNPGAANASPDTYGPSGGGDMPDWQDPPFPKDASTMAQSHDVIIKYLDYWADHAKHAAGEAQAVGLQVRGAETGGTDTRLVFKRGYDKESFVLGDLKDIFGRRTEPLVDRWVKAAADTAIQRDGCHGCAGEGGPEPSCSWRVTVVPIHQSLVPEEAATWTALRKDFADLYGFSRPWIQQIHDPARARVETAALETWVTGNSTAFAQAISNWQGEVAIDFAAGTNCNPPPELPAKKGTLKPYKIDPLACKSGEVHMNFGLANLNADCDQMILTFGEGAVFQGTYKFGKDWSDDQITIFGGAGVGGGLGPLALNANTGAFITLQNGHIVDYGNQTNAGVTVGYGPMSASAGVSSQIAGVSGVDVTTSTSTRVGGECTNSC